MYFRRPMDNPLTSYFVLNLFVTFTNKQILGTHLKQDIQRPHLLTAVHGMAGCIGVVGYRLLGHFPLYSGPPYSNRRRVSKLRKPTLTWRQHLGLAFFSLFYTINIALSNLSLAVMSLPQSQAIRATAPILTVIISIVVQRESVAGYKLATYLSLVLITFGIIIALSESVMQTTGPVESDLNSAHHSEHFDQFAGIAICFLGALTAAVKTIITHKLMTSLSLDMKSVGLLQVLSPYVVVQAASLAYFNSEFDSRPLDSSQLLLQMKKNVANVTQGYVNSPMTGTMIMSEPHHQITRSRSPLPIWFANAIAAFLLNIVSFRANRDYGPVSMAVIANMKQSVVLLWPFLLRSHYGGIESGIVTRDEVTLRIVVGTGLTIIGGLWYAMETDWAKEREWSRRKREKEKEK